jgi:N-acetylglucosaminyl-diphospho-decaprenol L-rhamnosyltransferase
VSSRVTVLVVTYNSADTIAECLASVELHGAGSRAIVADNASSDATVQMLEGRPFATLVRSAANEGFSKANNRALREVETEFALLLNPDARLTASALPQLLAAADRNPKGAVIGPRTIHEDGRPQVSFGSDLSPVSEYRQRKLVKGVKAGIPWAVAAWSEASARERRVDWVSGSCMLLRMAAARSVAFFDERYFLYEEDADLCLRLRKAGFEIVFAPQALVTHALGTSMAKSPGAARDAYDASHLLYYRLHRPPWEGAILKAMVWLRRPFGSSSSR